MKKSYLWIGPHAKQGRAEEISAYNPNSSFAAFLLQNYYIDGLKAVTSSPMDIIGAPRLNDYPSGTELFVRRDEWQLDDGSTGLNVSYLNFLYINRLFRTLSMRKAVKKWAKAHTGEDVLVFAYAMSSDNMAAVKELKKHLPSARAYLIVLDLPLFMGDMKARTHLRQFLKKIDWILIKSLMRYFDGYILITKYVAEYLKLRDGSWMIMEGIIDSAKLESEKIPIAKYDKKVCIYAGGLFERNKITAFAKAFIEAGVENSEFHIYGAGDEQEEFEALSRKHECIRYFGLKPSEYVFEEGRKAMLHVNPRSTTYEHTKYSFPSKTVECMASGTPLLTTRLTGIPEEYFEHVYVLEDESHEGMVRTIRDILNMSENELREKGAQAQEFLRREKTNIKQAEKIMNFIQQQDKSEGAQGKHR